MKEQSTEGLDGRRSIPFEHPRRQYIVCYGRDVHETTVGIEELAAAIRHHESIENEGEREDRRLVEVDLHHAHLPKLAAEGTIEYDQTERRIRFRDGSLGALGNEGTVTETLSTD